MVYLSRIEKFNAAHKLWVEGWSEEKNFAVFGKCSNKNWHGHNYTLHVTVKGHPDPVTGFVMDAKLLSTYMKQQVIDQIDHKNLNLDGDFLPKGMQPTSENIVILIWQRLEAALVGQPCQLHLIRLWETDTIYAEYYGIQ